MTPSETSLVVIGDSLTEHGTWPQVLSAEVDWLLQREGRSGQTSWEIALRVGARGLGVAEGERLPDGAISVLPDLEPGVVREGVDGGMDDIRVRGTLGDRPGELVHRVAVAAREGWSFHPDQPCPVQSGTRCWFQPDALRVPPGAIVVVWCGRNNPGPAVVDDVDAVLASLPDDARSLVLGLHAAAFEPAGSAGALVIAELNASLSRRHGARFVDVQAALASAHPVANGVAAARLRSDDVHLSAEGDAVVARVIRDRLRALNWWPHRAAR